MVYNFRLEPQGGVRIKYVIHFNNLTLLAKYFGLPFRLSHHFLPAGFPRGEKGLLCYIVFFLLEQSYAKFRHVSIENKKTEKTALPPTDADWTRWGDFGRAGVAPEEGRYKARTTWNNPDQHCGI